MTFSQYAGTAIVPTLSRLVLCVVFVATGYNKVFTFADIDAAQAARLKELGVDAIARSTAAAAAPSSLESPAATESPAPSEAAGGTGEFTVLSLHKLTLMLDQNGMRYPAHLAWAAAMTELVGGALILIGLFSRVWGLGLAIVMATAFYTVSMQINHVHQIHPFVLAENVLPFNKAIAQVGLFVMAFGVFLTGPGPLSADRLLFRNPELHHVAEGEEEKL